ncbi:MAG: DNRLRE domain-containing protein [Planctomycetes bacterium]|nr:DNRLRE domain-containing protein [Planctomycetota bacterium]
MIPTRSLLLTTLLAPVAAQTTIRIDPLADATVRSDAATTNYGSATELGLAKDMGTNGIFFMRSYFSFATTALQGQPPVIKATLMFYQNRAVAAGTLPVDVYNVTAPWAENAITWQTKPSDDNVSVDTVQVGSVSYVGWRTFDVTPLVLKWLANPSGNYGVVIRLKSESTAGAYRPAYGPSREHATTTQRPHLLVEVSDNREFGQGCGPVATWPRLSLTAGTAKLGGQFTITGALLSPSNTAITAIGLSNTVYMGIPLPYTLNGSVSPPCQLLVAPQIQLYGSADSNGNHGRTFPVPNDATLRGAHVYFQMASPTSPEHLTSGLEVTIY